MRGRASSGRRPRILASAILARRDPSPSSSGKRQMAETQDPERHPHNRRSGTGSSSSGAEPQPEAPEPSVRPECPDAARRGIPRQAGAEPYQREICSLRLSPVRCRLLASRTARRPNAPSSAIEPLDWRCATWRRRLRHPECRRARRGGTRTMRLRARTTDRVARGNANVRGRGELRGSRAHRDSRHQADTRLCRLVNKIRIRCIM
jgi:hypothetical protein